MNEFILQTRVSKKPSTKVSLLFWVLFFYLVSSNLSTVFPLRTLLQLLWHAGKRVDGRSDGRIFLMHWKVIQSSLKIRYEVPPMWLVLNLIKFKVTFYHRLPFHISIHPLIRTTHALRVFVSVGISWSSKLKKVGCWAPDGGIRLFNGQRRIFRQ